MESLRGGVTQSCHDGGAGVKPRACERAAKYTNGSQQLLRCFQLMYQLRLEDANWLHHNKLIGEHPALCPIHKKVTDFEKNLLSDGNS